MLRTGLLVGVAVVLAGCGARTAPIDDLIDAGPRREPMPETCNGVDDDLDTMVDEDFRDELGRYVADDHCGRCGDACRARGPDELEAHCQVIEESPVCAATRCVAPKVVSFTGRCVSPYDRLCLPCADDADCGDFHAATCIVLGEESVCTVACDIPCPEGYVCTGDGVCAPRGGSCSCDPGDHFTLACALHDPMGELCAGSTRCDDGVVAECAAFVDVCDHVDNDCNGTIDDSYRDARGAYSIDLHNCGECGVDCSTSTIPEGDLTCGGDPFAPRCVLLCPDTIDGIMPGDRVDADLDIANGCECTVTSLSDVPGPVRTSGGALDVNCDGADGIVVESFYVAPDGDDAGPGSPTRPLRTIAEAMRRASESISTRAPRPHVFVASGVYTETVELPDGVKLHGGYRRDFLSLDPDGFRVDVRAPIDTTAPGGAALVVRGAGTTDTVAEWISVRGVDARDPSAPAFGAYLEDPGSALSLREMTVRSGVAGAGMPGIDGMSGAAPTMDAVAGALPRASIENASHECSGGVENTVAGGTGGRSDCAGTDVSGGQGGSSHCPVFAEHQESGSSGRAPPGTPAGTGGSGGQDSEGPIRGISCSAEVCCGLADFTVPGDFMGPQPGTAGRDGTTGAAGGGCRDSLGRFDGDRWVPDVATAGTAGSAGSGGGGGGAGGGVLMDWTRTVCEWADGLGGGGGGGGAGACGGRSGTPGTSGAPSVAILVRYTAGARAVPTISRVEIAPSDGGLGGDGGAGGDGGLGGTGAIGRDLARSSRTTPTLAQPFPGGRGGKGGNGGAGGGAGGGCGGPSVGIWITGAGATEPPGAAAWHTGNTFRLGRGGVAGRGGGGAAAAADGAAGGASDVLTR